MSSTWRRSLLAAGSLLIAFALAGCGARAPVEPTGLDYTSELVAPAPEQGPAAQTERRLGDGARSRQAPDPHATAVPAAEATQQPAAEPVEIVRVAAAGDIACSPADPDWLGGEGSDTRCRQAHTAALLEGHDAVLALGDLQYPDGSPGDFAGSYDVSWGRFKDRTYPVIGNHEYRTPGAAGYFGYFGDAFGGPADGWYAVELGAWLVVGLNTNCEVVHCAGGSEQERWLRATLAGTDTSCQLVMGHHPRYSSGRYGDDAAVAPLFAAAHELGADLMLAGHAHHYERFAPADAHGNPVADGLPLITVGTGGVDLQPSRRAHPLSERVLDDAFGVLSLELGSNGYAFAFRPEHGGEPLDVGAGSCG